MLTIVFLFVNILCKVNEWYFQGGKRMQAQAVLFRGVNEVTVEAVEIPAPGPGEVLIQTACSTVSPGTELRCLAGRQPSPSP